jgi:hypothetical protein
MATDPNQSLRDVQCVECSYSLAGLQIEGLCPECAHPIAKSVAAARYPRALRVGLQCLGVGYLLLALPCLGLFFKFAFALKASALLTQAHNIGKVRRLGWLIQITTAIELLICLMLWLRVRQNDSYVFYLLPVLVVLEWANFVFITMLGTVVVEMTNSTNVRSHFRALRLCGHAIWIGVVFGSAYGLMADVGITFASLLLLPIALWILTGLCLFEAARPLRRSD